MFEEVGVDTAWCSQLFGVDACHHVRRRRHHDRTHPVRHQRHPDPLPAPAGARLPGAHDQCRHQRSAPARRRLVSPRSGRRRPRPELRTTRRPSSRVPRVLRRAIDGERFEHHGEFLDVDTTTDFGRARVVDAPAPTVLVGTMFPLSLKVAGALADGVVTWLVGLRTLTDVIAPISSKAATAAGRPRPEVIAGVPMAVCAVGEVAAQNELVNRTLERFTKLPVYESVLEREHATCRADLARRRRGDRRRPPRRVRRGRHRRGPRRLLRRPRDLGRTAALLGTLARSRLARTPVVVRGRRCHRSRLTTRRYPP